MGLNAYALVNFVAALLLAVGLLAAGKSLARGELGDGRRCSCCGRCSNIGGIFDHRRWALPSELLRLPVTAAVLAARLPEGVCAAPSWAAWFCRCCRYRFGWRCIVESLMGAASCQSRGCTDRSAFCHGREKVGDSRSTRQRRAGRR